MFISKAARRYASALFELAKDQEELQEVLADITDIHQTVEGSKELVTFLRSPVIKIEDKSEALQTLFFEDIQPSTKLLVRLLSQKDRVELLPQIAQAFINKYRDYAGIITVEVSVARGLSENQQSELRKSLELKTQKKVELNITCDESLRGGMAIRIGDTVIDGTIKHKVAELEKTLLSAAV